MGSSLQTNRPNPPQTNQPSHQRTNQQRIQPSLQPILPQIIKPNNQPKRQSILPQRNQPNHQPNHQSMIMSHQPKVKPSQMILAVTINRIFLWKEQTKKDCKWAGKGTNKNIIKKCKKNNGDGNKVRDYCPKTCATVNQGLCA